MAIIVLTSWQSVNAIDKNESICDPICSQESVEKTIIIEKQDKQLADLNKTIVNLTNNESGNIFWRNVSIGISIVASIIAIIIKIDSWKKSNEIYTVYKAKPRKLKPSLITLKQTQKKLEKRNMIQEQ